MENNIEEDIKILENMNDGYTFKDCDICNNYNEKTKQCDKHKCMELQAIEHILSDYKKLQEDFEQIDHECNRLEEKEFKLENKINKLKNEMQKDKMEQFDDYVIYLIEKYLKILEK